MLKPALSANEPNLQSILSYIYLQLFQTIGDFDSVCSSCHVLSVLCNVCLANWTKIVLTSFRSDYNQMYWWMSGYDHVNWHETGQCMDRQKN